MFETRRCPRGGRASLASSLLGALVLVLALPPTTHAQAPRVVRATVVLIDGLDVFVDLPAPTATTGLVLRLYRPIEVTHPVTRRRLRDRFFLGEIEIVAPGEVLSRARPHGELARTVALGDVCEVELAPPVVAVVEPPAAAAAASEAAEPPSAPTAPPELPTYRSDVADSTLDPETASLLELLEDTLGRPPEHRAIVLRNYLRAHPRGRYDDALRAELTSMQRYATLTGGGDVETRTRLIRAAFRADRIEHAAGGVARDLAVGIEPTTPLRAVRLHVRTRGAPAYTTLDFLADGPTHARVTIPAELVTPPSIEYFVEATDVEGLTVPVVGEPGRPITVDVSGDAPGTRIPHRSIRVSGEYVGFDTFAGTPGRDWYFLGEVDVLYRVLADWLYGVRLGFAALGGQSRNVDDLRRMGTPLEPFPAGFTYGYLELEGHFVELLGIAGRLELGLGVPGDPLVQAAGVNVGGQLRIRIGEEYGTHLLLAGEFSTAVGQRAFVALAWSLAPEWPSRVEVHVTDQPVSTGLGVRVVVEQGYRLGDFFAIALRLSYQGRRIDHTGIGGGLTLSFDW